MSHHEAESDEVLNENGEITIQPRGLQIVWGKDDRYWKLPGKNTLGSGSAELKQVCWLEITGSVDGKYLDAGKTYKIEFIVSMKADAFGWSGCPVFMMAKVGKMGRYVWKKIKSLDEKKRTEFSTEFSIPGNGNELEIVVPANPQEKTIFFGLYEVWSGKWKGGLLIHKAIIRPK